MRDLDSAVGRLDNIFMSVYFIIVVITVSAVSFVRRQQPRGYPVAEHRYRKRKL